MSTFFLTFLATALATLAGRDGVRVARLAAAHGGAGMLIVAGILAGLVYAALAAWLAQGIAPVLAGPAARLFVAIALAVAGLEVLFLRAGSAPVEPTRSVFATFVVLASALLTGAAGFLVLALTILRGEMIFAAVGGALGAIAAFAITAIAAEDWEKVPLGAMRWGVAGLLVAAAIITGYLALTSG